MAYGKLREKLIIIISAFTCITLIQCRSPELVGTRKTHDERGEIISEQYKSDEGYESSVNFKYLEDDASISELYKKLIIKGQLVSSSEAVWNAMSPTLRCGDDLMKLQLSGPAVTQVELCQRNGAPVPLTRLPPHCGHITPTRGGLLYATPYDGCGVAQQEGSYVMQMQWHGNSAIISCPMTSSTANETFFGPHPFLLSRSPPVSPAAITIAEASMIATKKPSEKYSQAFLQTFWPYYYPYYHYPGKVYPTPNPTEKPTTTARDPTDKPFIGQVPNEKPQQPSGSQIFWPYYPHYHYPRKPHHTSTPTFVSTTPTTTVVQPQAQKSQPLKYPQMFWPYYYPHYHGKPKPTVTPVPTSAHTTLSVAQAPPERPYSPGSLQPQGFWPFYYPHYLHHGNPKPTEKPVLTSIPTTSVAQAQIQKLQPQGYPQMFWAYYYSPYYQHSRPKPIEKPIPALIPITTSAAQAPTQKPQPPGYPQIFWPFYYYPVRPKPTEKPAPAFPTTSPSSLSATGLQLQPQMYPGKIYPPYNHYPSYLHHLQQFALQYPVHAPKSTITPPITTTPQPCTTAVAAECKPSDIQLPNEPPQYYIAQNSMLYKKRPLCIPFCGLVRV